MLGNVGGAARRLLIFSVVCALGTFGLFMVFAQLRFHDETVYNALFINVTGLQQGNFVRIAGVEVGKVKHISVRSDATVLVAFSADDSVLLTAGTKAVIRYDNVIGDRYVELEEGTGGLQRLRSGETIPVERTRPALDLDALIGGFRPLFRALNPDQVNALSTQLIQAFQGQGPTISSFLAQTAAVTNTLADRDQLIGQVIVNLNAVLASFGEQAKQFDKAVVSLASLTAGLSHRKTDIANSIAYTNEAAGTVADLLTYAREPFKGTVTQSDRASSIVVADHEYVDNLLNTLPDAYQALGRQGLYGDYFAFYLCDVVLKVNGKGGQPVYVKAVGQTSGRCAPR